MPTKYLTSNDVRQIANGHYEAIRQELINQRIDTINASNIIPRDPFPGFVRDPFPGFVRHLRQIPRDFLPGFVRHLRQLLQGTSVSTLYLSGNKIAQYAPQLAANLKGTSVTTLHLQNNNIAGHAPQVAANLKGTSVSTLDLGGNSIAEHAPQFAANLKGTHVTTLSLWWNNIAGHAPQFAANLKGTHVTTLSLWWNNIAGHAPQVAANLKGTSVTTLGLSRNGIAEHAPQVARNLKGTSVIELPHLDTYAGPSMKAFEEAMEFNKVWPYAIYGAVKQWENHGDYSNKNRVPLEITKEGDEGAVQILASLPPEIQDIALGYYLPGYTKEKRGFFPICKRHTIYCMEGNKVIPLHEIDKKSNWSYASSVEDLIGRAKALRAPMLGIGAAASHVLLENRPIFNPMAALATAAVYTGVAYGAERAYEAIRKRTADELDAGVDTNNNNNNNGEPSGGNKKQKVRK